MIAGFFVGVLAGALGLKFGTTVVSFMVSKLSPKKKA